MVVDRHGCTSRGAVSTDGGTSVVWGAKNIRREAIFLSAKPLLTLSLVSMPCLASLGQGAMHIQVFGSAHTDMHILTTVGAWKYTIRCVFWVTFSAGSQFSSVFVFIGQIMYTHLFFLAISFGWVCGPEILVHFVIRHNTTVMSYNLRSPPFLEPIGFGVRFFFSSLLEPPLPPRDVRESGADHPLDPNY